MGVLSDGGHARTVLTQINTIASDELFSTRQYAAMVFIFQEKGISVFHNERFQPYVPSQWRKLWDKIY